HEQLAQQPQASCGFVGKLNGRRRGGDGRTKWGSEFLGANVLIEECSASEAKLRRCTGGACDARQTEAAAVGRPERHGIRPFRSKESVRDFKFRRATDPDHQNRLRTILVGKRHHRSVEPALQWWIAKRPDSLA